MKQTVIYGVYEETSKTPVLQFGTPDARVVNIRSTSATRVKTLGKPIKLSVISYN